MVKNKVSKLQMLEIKKDLLSAVTLSIVTAVIYQLILKAYSVEGIMLRDYVNKLMGVLILLPAVVKYLAGKPKECFRLVIWVEVLGLFLMCLYTLGYGPKEFIATNVIMVSFVLMMKAPHSRFVSSRIVDGSADYSVISAQVNIVAGLIFALIGFIITFMKPELHYLLIICMVLRVIQGRYMMEIVNTIYD